MNDRPHNKNLEDLLKNLKSNKTEGFDDFEREALEGFETLSSKEEAIKIKNELDKEISYKLFLEEKKNQKVYWFAAAGLFLVIGLSVFFILNNRPLEDNNVAIVKKEEPKILDEVQVVPAPAEEKAAEVKEPAKTKTIAAVSKDEAATEKTNGISSRAVLKPGKKASGETTDDIVDAKKPEDKNDFAYAETDEKPKVAYSSPVEDKESKKLEEQSNKAPATKTLDADKLEANESLAREELKKESKGKDKDSRKKQSAAKDQKETEGNMTSETTSKSAVVNSSIAQNSNSTNAGLKNTGAGNANSIPASSNEPQNSRADNYNTPTNQVYYSGGEDGLMKDIREKLIEEKTDKKFDALLVINEKKQVEKVNYLNVFDLTVEEKNKVTAILKALNKFNFYIQPNTKGLFEYKLKYRP